MIKKGIHVPHSVIVKSPGLLPMLYRVMELAQEFNIPERTLRDWLASGAPYSRDSKNRIWVNGTEFAAWVANQRKPKKASKLTDHQGFCFRCNQIVEIANPETVFIRGKLTNTRGSCPVCGCVINRGGRIPTVTTRSAHQESVKLKQE